MVGSDALTFHLLGKKNKKQCEKRYVSTYTGLYVIRHYDGYVVRDADCDEGHSTDVEIRPRRRLVMRTIRGVMRR